MMDKQELLNVLDKQITKEEKRAQETIDDNNWINGYSCGRTDALEFGYKKAEWIDEPEITTEEAWEKIAENYSLSVEKIQDVVKAIISAVVNEENIGISDGHVIIEPDFSKPENPEIPKKIANKIEFERVDGQSDSAIYSILQSEKKTRMWSIAHKDDLMKALVNGFEIQKEPAWLVRINEKLYFCRFTDKYFEKDSDAPTYIESGNPSLIKKFTNKDKAEAVATLVDGVVEEWSE